MCLPKPIYIPAQIWPDYTFQPLFLWAKLIQAIKANPAHHYLEYLKGCSKNTYFTLPHRVENYLPTIITGYITYSFISIFPGRPCPCGSAPPRFLRRRWSTPPLPATGLRRRGLLSHLTPLSTTAAQCRTRTPTSSLLPRNRPSPVVASLAGGPVAASVAPGRLLQLRPSTPHLD